MSSGEPVEKPPKPTVTSPSGKKRAGKGFSRGELEEVGLTFRDALKLGIPIDKKRRSKHEENVKLLKSYLDKIGWRRKS